VASHDIARLYRRHHRDLERAVTAAVRAPREVVEDACQTAWTIMLRSQPRRATWFAWLRVVAIREAWQQYALSRNERAAGAFISPDGYLGPAASESWRRLIVRVDDMSSNVTESVPRSAWSVVGRRRDMTLFG
jgi:hypothetical protein